ncbi:choice-of-anchor U domain-containing protein [uncultured Thiohalocapsa sp.]|uniref:choice-of-anchor U domain-containing protein n=1 Tax=uncultured Thiohalocapsa sp. TaxID=768990 RepID=UPI0025F63025|nr:choice-of-anchor U domain-containing protein [uncultured Thiohalocapsa sp.]
MSSKTSIANAVALATVTVGAAFWQPSAMAIDACTQDYLRNASNHCGNDRGNYVLRSEGRALYGREAPDTADKAELVIRRPTRVGRSFQLVEEVLQRVGDPVTNASGSYTGTMNGLGSNPHMNNHGQAVWQISTQDGWQGFYVGSRAADIRPLAGTDDVVDGYTLCGDNRSGYNDSLEPWPQIGDGGHVVIGGQVVRGPGRECQFYPDDPLAQQAVFRIPYDTGIAQGQAVLQGDRLSEAGNAPDIFAVDGALIGADHPFLPDARARLTYVDAISHSADMVAADGALVVDGALQVTPPGYTIGETLARDANLRVNSAILHVDAQGTPAIVAMSGGDVSKAASPLIAADDRVVYREAAAYDDDTVIRIVDPTERRCFQLTGTLAAAEDVEPDPDFEPEFGEVQAGEYGYSSALELRLSGTRVDGFSIFCRSDFYGCAILAKAGGSSLDKADWALRILGKGNAFCMPNEDADAIIAGAGAGELTVAISGSTEVVGSRVGPMAFTVNASNLLGPFENRYIEGGAIKAWTPSTGQTETVVDFWSKSPAGFSRIEGATPHFDAGVGLVAFRAGLETPYNSTAGEEGDNPFPAADYSSVATALGDPFPCESVHTGEFGDFPSKQLEAAGRDYPGDTCQAIYVRSTEGLTEIARNKTAAAVFADEDDATLTGVTEADGFEFWELGATVVVTDDGTVFFNAMTGQTFSGAGGACASTDSPYYGQGSDRGGFDGIFAYRDGVVRKVVAECDVLSDGSQVLELQLPQPELRQAAYEDAFLVKALLDTDADGTDDTVALLGLTSPDPAVPGAQPRVVYEGDRGFRLVSYSQAGGEVAISVLDPADEQLDPPRNGWALTNIEVSDAANAQFLPVGANFPDGLVSFTAENGEPESVIYLSLRFPAAPADVLSLLKDVEDAPNLIERVESDGQGGSLVTFSIQDNGPYDFDDRESYIFDPVALNVVLAATPIPALGWPAMALLAGLLGLAVAVFSGPRRTGA